MFMIVIDGPAGNGIGQKIAASLNLRYIKTESQIFPDGESKIRIADMPKSEEAIIVQSTYFPQDKHVMELLFIADELTEKGVKNIIAVVPYLAYARQNKRFLLGETLSINTIMKLLNSFGINSLITVEPHKYEVVSKFKGHSKIVETDEAFAGYMSRKTKEPFIISPDKGAIKSAEKIASLLKCEYSYVDKKRDPATGALLVSSDFVADLKGKDAIIVDDMISTGGTIEQAALMVKSKGPKSITVFGVHLLMVNDAYERIKKAGVDQLIGTNTVPYEKAKIIDISKEITDAIKEIEKQST